MQIVWRLMRRFGLRIKQNFQRGALCRRLGKVAHVQNGLFLAGQNSMTRPARSIFRADVPEWRVYLPTKCTKPNPDDRVWHQRELRVSPTHYRTKRIPGMHCAGKARVAPADRGVGKPVARKFLFQSGF